MLSRLREHLGTAGLVIAIAALVAALAGGAIAATGGSGDGKATASAKAKKGPRGPKGPKGDTGPQGPAGAQGTAGAKGDTGAPGSNGSNGKDGATGPTGPDGPAGPAGKDGKTGFTETLPSGKTETGTWAAGFGGTGSVNFETKSTDPVGTLLVPISFPIPLEAAPELTLVQLSYGLFAEPFEDFEIEEILEEGAEHGCPGFDEGVPMADPGHLCVYASYLAQLEPKGTGLTNTIRSPSEPPQIFTGGSVVPEPNGANKVPGTGVTGTTLEMVCKSSGCNGLGLWAVTAE